MSFEEFNRSVGANARAKYKFVSGSVSYHQTDYDRKKSELCVTTDQRSASQSLVYKHGVKANPAVVDAWLQCKLGGEFACYATHAPDNGILFLTVSAFDKYNGTVVDSFLDGGTSQLRNVESGELFPMNEAFRGPKSAPVKLDTGMVAVAASFGVEIAGLRYECRFVEKLDVSAQVEEILARPPLETSFGGAWFASADGTCLRPNPFSGGCSCPSGFVGDVVTGGPFKARFGFCVASTLDRLVDFGGVAYQYEDECLVRNRFTGQCTSCPGDMARLDVAAHRQEGDPVGGFPGGIQVCHAPELQDSRFGGLFYGFGTTRTGNPYLDGSNEVRRARDKWGRRYGCPEGYRQIDYTGLDAHNFPGGLSICVKI